jgi:hypothetical protein
MILHRVQVERYPDVPYFYFLNFISINQTMIYLISVCNFQGIDRTGSIEH